MRIKNQFLKLLKKLLFRIGMNNNNNEWIVGFHGFPHDDENLILKKVIDQGFKIGARQLWKDAICIKTQEKVGVGIYFTPHIEVAEIYCANSPIELDGKKYLLIF